MLIEKDYITRITMNDVNERNLPIEKLKEVIKNKIKEKFEGRCFKSSLIKKITKINNEEFIIIIDESLSGSAHIDISFTAEAEVLIEGEIIFGKVVKKPVFSASNSKTNIMIIGENLYASINDLDIKNDYFLIGNTYPFIVKSAAYNLYGDNITVLCRPFLPVFFSSKDVYFEIKNGGITSAEQQTLEYLLNYLSKMKIQYNKLAEKKETKKIIQFLEGIIKPKSKLNFKGKSLPIDEKTLLSLDSGIICYDSAKNSHNIIIGTSEPSADIKFVPAIHAINYIITEYIKYLEMIIKMADIYPNIQVMKKYTELWGMFKSNS